MALRIVLALLIVLSVNLPTAPSAEAAPLGVWSTIGRLPFTPSSIVSDGDAIYAASAVEKRIVRVRMKARKLLAAENVRWPGGAADRVVLTLAKKGLYATLVEPTRTTIYRMEITGTTLGGQWRPVDGLGDGAGGWLTGLGIDDRVWLLDAHGGSWLHGMSAYAPSKYRLNRFNTNVDLGTARRGAVLIGTPQYLYVLGGDQDPSRATTVPLKAGGKIQPRENGRLAAPLHGGSAAIHGSMLYAIGNSADGVQVHRTQMLHDGRFDLWAKLVSPAPGAPSVAAVAIQGYIVIARGDGSVDALSVAEVAPGLKRIIWNVDTSKERIIHPGETLVERIPWEYDGPEEVTGFQAWTYATGRASRLRDSEASLAGTHIEAGGGTGKTLVLVITIPKGSKRKDYWSVVVLKIRGRPLGSVLRVHHTNPNWR